MSDDSAIPKLNKSTPKNLAGTKKEGKWPAYQKWALNISKENGKVTEFFETECPEFVDRNKTRRENMRKIMRTIRTISTKSRSDSQLDIDDAYKKLSTAIGQITDIEGETDEDIMNLIDKVDDWDENEEFKKLDVEQRKDLIACVTEGLNMDKDVQHSFISHTLYKEKATLLKKYGPNPFVSDAIPKPTQVFVPEVTKKWAKSQETTSKKHHN